MTKDEFNARFHTLENIYLPKIRFGDDKKALDQLNWIDKQLYPKMPKEPRKVIQHYRFIMGYLSLLIDYCELNRIPIPTAGGYWVCSIDHDNSPDTKCDGDLHYGVLPPL